MKYDAAEDIKAIGQRAKFIRMQKGLTQYDVVEMLGVGRQHLSNFERGRTNMRLETLLKLHKVLGCPMKDFFCDVDMRDEAEKGNVKADMFDALMEYAAKLHE